MGAKELAKYLGQEVPVTTHNGLVVNCTITDAKVAWGEVRLEVTPVSGEGSAWIVATTRQLERVANG